MKEEPQFAHPQTNVLQAGFKPGDKIGEFGCGSGHVALALSGIVGEHGKVYAIDLQQDVLTHLRDTLLRRGVKNVDTVYGDVEKAGGTRLRDHVLDGIVLSNVLFQIEDTDGLISEVKRTLASGGKLMVTDWAGSYSGIGPAKERIVTEHQAEELFIEAGFHKVKSWRAGAHHYSILFTKPL